MIAQVHQLSRDFETAIDADLADTQSGSKLRQFVQNQRDIAVQAEQAIAEAEQDFADESRRIDAAIEALEIERADARLRASQNIANHRQIAAMSRAALSVKPSRSFDAGQIAAE